MSWFVKEQHFLCRHRYPQLLAIDGDRFLTGYFVAEPGRCTVHQNFSGLNIRFRLTA